MEKRKYTKLNAEFQRIERRDKKACDNTYVESEKMIQMNLFTEQKLTDMKKELIFTKGDRDVGEGIN